MSIKDNMKRAANLGGYNSIHALCVDHDLCAQDVYQCAALGAYRKRIGVNRSVVRFCKEAGVPVEDVFGPDRRLIYNLTDKDISVLRKSQREFVSLVNQLRRESPGAGTGEIAAITGTTRQAVSLKLIHIEGRVRRARDIEAADHR